MLEYLHSIKIIALLIRFYLLANRVIEKNPRLYDKRLEVTRDGEFEAPKLLIYEELFISTKHSPR